MSVKLITPVFRASYARVHQPSQTDDGKDVYSISMIFSKVDTPEEEITKIKNAIRAAAAEKWGKDESKWPRGMRIPLRDADTEDRTNPSADGYDENYVNTYFMNAKSFNKPGIVNENVEPIMQESEFYSGCYARASVAFAAYDKAGNRGVGCYLSNLMKTADGDPIGGGAPAHADFAAFKPEESAQEELPFN